MNRSTVAQETTADRGTQTAERAHDPVRSRIIEATFELLTERGYAGAGTREIARRARVSKRELYALFGSKQGILSAMIARRSARMRLPLAPADVADRNALADTLAGFGAALMREACRPAVMALFRLAIIEAERSPDVARALDEEGRQATRAALAAFLGRARSLGLITGAEPPTMATQFLALLWEDLPVSLLMGRREPPATVEIERRARAAATTLLALYPGGPATA